MGQEQLHRRATAPTEHRRRSTDTTHPFYPPPQTAAIIGCTGQYTRLGRKPDGSTAMPRRAFVRRGRCAWCPRLVALGLGGFLIGPLPAMARLLYVQAQASRAGRH
jgi:hypothetical protein